MSISEIRDLVAERTVVATVASDTTGAALRAWTASGCTAEDLTEPYLRTAMQSMLDAVAVRGACSVADALATAEQYADTLLSDLTQCETSDLSPYLRSVRIHAQQREAMTAIQRHLHTAATARTPEDRLDALSAAKATHIPSITAGADKTKAEVLLELYEQDLTGIESTPPVPTSLSSLDRVLGGGFRGSRLYVLSSRPGGGKTSLALAMLAAACKAGKRVAFVSLEMEASELHRRLASYLSGVPLLGNRKARPDEAIALRDAYATMSDWQYEIWDRPPRSYDEIVQWLCAHHEQSPLGLVILDYLQLLPSTGAERDDLSIGQHATRSKMLAKLLVAPFLLIAQPNRAAEQRGDGRYRMSDLRGSGQIEQDADWIGFVWQPQHGSKAYPEGYAELDVAKHRHGPKARLRLDWHGATYRFSDSTEDLISGVDTDSKLGYSA